MKLYTEEQLLNTIKSIRLYDDLYDWKVANERIEKHLKALHPIELPKDEERINKFNGFIITEVALEFLTKEQGERLKWYYETYLVK